MSIMMNQELANLSAIRVKETLERMKERSPLNPSLHKRVIHSKSDISRASCILDRLISIAAESSISTNASTVSYISPVSKESSSYE